MVLTFLGMPSFIFNGKSLTGAFSGEQGGGKRELPSKAAFELFVPIIHDDVLMPIFPNAGVTEVLGCSWDHNPNNHLYHVRI